jgi:hypothetical protein
VYVEVYVSTVLRTDRLESIVGWDLGSRERSGVSGLLVLGAVSLASDLLGPHEKRSLICRLIGPRA